MGALVGLGLLVMGVGGLLLLAEIAMGTSAATGLSTLVTGLVMMALGSDLNAIRDRLPEPPKTEKQLRREAEHQARMQESARLAEERRLQKEQERQAGLQKSAPLTEGGKTEQTQDAH